MGVTTDWFAFDPAAFAAPPTCERLRAAGHLDDAWQVRPGTLGLAAVPSWFEGNKRWYRNIDGDDAWRIARAGVTSGERAPYDRWFGHLFWDTPPDAGCACGLAPQPVAEGEVIYTAALLRHIVELARPLDPVADALRAAFADGPPSFAGYPWIYTPEGFATLVDAWQQTVERVVRERPGWSLLRGVWV